MEYTHYILEYAGEPELAWWRWDSYSGKAVSPTGRHVGYYKREDWVTVGFIVRPIEAISLENE